MLKEVKLAVLFGAVCLAFLMLSPRAVAMETGAKETVGILYDAIKTMKRGPELGPRERYAQIEPVTRRTFDIQLMTRVLVGTDKWKNLDGTQKHGLGEAFESYIAGVYADRFKSYSGQRLEVTGEQPWVDGRLLVTSRIITSTSEVESIDYLMQNNGGVWQIVDVYYKKRTVSELATWREGFSSILRDQGTEKLALELKLKANELSDGQAWPEVRLN